MKKLIILLILSSTLFAQNLSYTIPLALQKKLCDQLANNSNRCENGSTLTYSKHKNLSNNRLLLFLYLNEHVDTMYDGVHDDIAILIDNRGRWISTVGENIISEDIQSIDEDPHGNIWVRAFWQIEGVYPTLYHSHNGLTWKQTTLPENRDVDCCFETLDKPIFLYNTISLTFRNNEGNNAKSWVASYESALSSNPIWQTISKIPSSSIENLQTNNWKVKKNKSSINFVNNYLKKTIYLPTSTKTHKKVYHIQLGAYGKKSSAQKAQKTLNHLAYSSKIIKGKKYHKLMIGEFTSTRKAKFILSKLKREHPKNKSIQKAFVFASKN